MKRISALALVLGSALAAVPFVHAEEIISTVGSQTGDIQPFGSDQTQSYGETFTAQNSFLNTFTFFFDRAAGAAPTAVTAEVYQWYGSLTGGAGDQGTEGPSLFSAPEVITSDSLTVQTGGIALANGTNYILFLTLPSNDATEYWDIDFDGHPGATGDGGFNFSNYTDQDAAWDDFADFGSLEYIETFNSFAIPVTGGATPEPGSLTLLGTGVLGLAGIARRRFTR